MLYSTLRSVLFRLDPEEAHHLILKLAHLSPTLGKLTGVNPSEKLSLSVGNNLWRSPIALAAGLDKNADALDFFAAQGFGAIECGTLTLKAQDGNPRPRIWRYPEEASLRNAMGFPNAGLLKTLPHLRSYSKSTPLGVNIGKNKDTTSEESIEELSILLSTLQDHADYFVINVSSPNTPGLRALQEKTYLDELFSELKQYRQKDLYLKIAPDLDNKKLHELGQIACEHKLTGIIATNTTMIAERGIGGVSGMLLKEKAQQVRQELLNMKLPLEIIAVGGITTTRDIFDFWSQGGRALQIYTAYIYQGPAVLKNIYRDILNMLHENHINNLDDFFKLPLSERQDILK